MSFECWIFALLKIVLSCIELCLEDCCFYSVFVVAWGNTWIARLWFEKRCYCVNRDEDEEKEVKIEAILTRLLLTFLPVVVSSKIVSESMWKMFIRGKMAPSLSPTHRHSLEKSLEEIFILVVLVVMLTIRTSISRSGMVLFRTVAIIMTSFILIYEDWVGMRHFFEDLFGSYTYERTYPQGYFYQGGTWEPEIDMLSLFPHPKLTSGLQGSHNNPFCCWNLLSTPSSIVIFYLSSRFIYDCWFLFN